MRCCETLREVTQYKGLYSNDLTMNNSIFFDFKPQNKVQSAKEKLQMHRARGKQTNISIFEAAQLMDMVVFGNSENNVEMVFTLSLN